MESIFLWMDFTRQDLCNDTKIAQFRVQRRKLWHPEAEKEKQRKLLIIITLQHEFLRCSMINSRWSLDMLPCTSSFHFFHVAA